MIGLKWLNIRYGIHFGKFDAALLPRKLEYICLNIGRLTYFPYFGRYTPKMTTVLSSANNIPVIPSEFIVENLALKELYFNSSGLTTIPDLYHLPLKNASAQQPHHLRPISVLDSHVALDEDLISPMTSNVRPWAFYKAYCWWISTRLHWGAIMLRAMEVNKEIASRISVDDIKANSKFSNWNNFFSKLIKKKFMIQNQFY